MSLSGQILSSITAFRNPHVSEESFTLSSKPVSPLKATLAEVGYLLTIPFAAVETAFSVIAKLFSGFLPLSQENHRVISRWLHSSAFSVVRATEYAVANFFNRNLLVSEKGDRLLSGLFS